MILESLKLPSAIGEGSPSIGLQLLARSSFLTVGVVTAILGVVVTPGACGSSS